MAQEQITGDKGTVTAPPADTQGQATTQPPQEETVPLKSLQEERRIRQAAQLEAENYRRQVEILQQAVPQSRRDPDELVSNRELEQMLAEYDSKAEARERDRLRRQQAEVARMKYPDFDEVFKIVMQEAETSPDLAAAIMDPKINNPAELAYRIGKSNPSYLEKIQKKAAQGVAEKINENLNKTKTLSDAGGGGTPSIEKDWRKLAGTGSKELQDKIEEVKLRRR